MKKPLIVKLKGKPGLAHRLHWGFSAGCVMDVIESDVIDGVLFHQVWTPNNKKLWLQSDEVEEVVFHRLSKREQKQWNDRQLARLKALKKDEQQNAINQFIRIINSEE